MPSPDVPHLRHPFVLGDDGKIGMVEQDTVEHVMSCEVVIASCPTGFRDDRPEFGWDFPEFRSAPLDTSSLEDALRRWESRGKITAQEYADAANAAIRNIVVNVEVDA